ncbi:hypothetical protein Acr_00g0063740 [Actinidia rufa]|uniref:Uncharacterized protein n=1 Tax=Actinidia rufa TaxID=165716 RepID=A0A7J0DPB6_9ERIC|nr:hypothetical protein Acr_00g0063740 [Actinidia rufa]
MERNIPVTAVPATAILLTENAPLGGVSAAGSVAGEGPEVGAGGEAMTGAGDWDLVAGDGDGVGVRTGDGDGDGVAGAGAGTGVGDGDGGGVAGAGVGVAVGEILGEAAGDCARHEVVNRASNNRIRQLEPIRIFFREREKWV